MRLFIAVELPKAVRNEVGAALKELKMLSSGCFFRKHSVRRSP